jgi:tetratricopeptide (TPR) repeat protein
VPADPAAADAIRSLLGQSDASTSAEEIAWAFRKTLEQAASAAPLVVLFDDIQWAEETFLDLIEHVALLSSGAPILMLCLARPELGELRAGWPVTLRLEPLGAADVDELIPDRISGDLRGRITRAAGGNPLFVEEMVAMADETEGDVTVPPTLRALLAARIDQLEAAERGVLERGSIEGEVFHRSAVQALSSTEVSVTPRLASLVRKELIRPDTPALPGEDGFRFRHLLIRDAAYDALPKAVRAELHERFATWLDEHGTDLVELDEIVGYHLEQAHRYRTELGAPDDRVAAAGRIRLVAAGRNAAARLDFGAAASLLERGLRLAPTEEIDVAAELELVNALNQIGRGIDAVERARSLESRGAARRDRTTELVGRLQATLVQSAIDPSGTNERLDALVAEALPAFQAARDDIALHVAYHASGRAAFVRVRMDSALDAFERAAVHARRTPLAESFLGWRALCRVYGTTPASGILGWLDGHDTSASDPFFRTARARVLALLGRLDDARTLLVEIRSGLADRGQSVVLGAVTGIASTDVELLARDAAAAAALGEAGCRMLEELGDEGFLSSAATCYARALYQLDRLDEAEAWALRAAGLGARDDAFTQVASLSVQANVLARRGDHARAEALAAQATAIADGTDSLWHRGDARAELAEVLVLGGRRNEAVASLREALALYVRKENNVAAARTVERLLELGVEDTRAPRSSAPGTGRRRR